MDILNDNNDNDDVHMADSASNDNNNSGGEEGDVDDNNRDGVIVIDHKRLRALSNYADQNEDNRSYYWQVTDPNQPGNILYPAVGWPRYRPLSSLSEVEREEIRVGETKMISHVDPEMYEGTGISLDWGEYYVADDEMSSCDEEQSSLSSCEEAVEIVDEQLDREAKQAHISIINDASLSPSAMNFVQLDSDVDAPTPTLMGIPDIILEKILHYSTEKASEVCLVELVCKRIRRLTTGEEFWARHPASSKAEASLAKTYTNGLSEICSNFSKRYYGWLKRCKKDISDLPFSRQLACELEAIGRIRLFQSNCSNSILNVLGDDGDCVAGTFRTLSADILSRMNHLGPEAHFRLRGDTIGYVSELLQGYMIDRLQVAIHLALHKLGGVTEDIKCVVREDDIALAFQKDMFSPFFCGFSPQAPRRCNVAKGDHGGSAFDCPCSLPSSSGIIWKWPSDNCHDILPPEAGRRIIRRLAYQAGILQISNEAFLLAEAELLHTLGMLLVSTYESSAKIAKTTKFLGAKDELAYNEPADSVDMFKTPPPPFRDEQLVYTIVPGQIRTAAEQRDITPYKVYGDVWVASSGFTEKEDTKEEEMDIERSYYYQSISSSDGEQYSDSDSDILNWKYERIGSKAKVEDDLDDWSECSSVEDSEMDMDYEELAEYRLEWETWRHHYE